MTTLRIHGPGDIRLDDVPLPACGPNDVVLQVAACGICGSDLGWSRAGAQRPGGEPWPLGHEVAGTVAQVGAQVHGITAGMRMVLNPMGNPQDVIGCSGSQGGFGDRLLVRDAVLGRSLLPVPAHLSLERAALVEPLGVALHGVNRCNPQPGEKVVIFGAGPIGLGAVLWLRQRGLSDIVSVDLSLDRLARAKALGATHTIHAATEDVATRLAELHGQRRHMFWDVVGTDAFIEMSGGQGVIQRVIDMARPGARLTVVAVHHEPQPIAFETMLMKEMKIETSMGYPTELPDVLAALAALPDDAIAPYVSHTLPAQDILQAFEIARTPQSAKVMVRYTDA